MLVRYDVVVDGRGRRDGGGSSFDRLDRIFMQFSMRGLHDLVDGIVQSTSGVASDYLPLLRCVPEGFMEVRAISTILSDPRGEWRAPTRYCKCNLQRIHSNL